MELINEWFSIIVAYIQIFVLQGQIYIMPFKFMYAT